MEFVDKYKDWCPVLFSKAEEEVEEYNDKIIALKNLLGVLSEGWVSHERHHAGQRRIEKGHCRRSE